MALHAVAVADGVVPKASAIFDLIGSLTDTQFMERWERATSSLVDADNRVRLTYGSVSARWIPVKPMITPLSALLAHARDAKLGADAYEKIDRWYWGSVFSERYDSAVNTTATRDVAEMRIWLDGGDAPAWRTRLTKDGLSVDLDVGSRSAIYRGVISLLAARQSVDFNTAQPANLHECDDDHIFPRSVYRSKASVDRLPNRALISSATNKSKSKKRPSQFLPLFLKGHGNNVASLDETLSTHLIGPAAKAALEADDFDAFVEARAQDMRSAIADATGLPVKG